MKKIIFKVILVALITGVVYAGLLALMDNKQGIEFDTQKFVIRALLYGCGMGIISYIALQKREKKKNNPKS